MKDRRRQKEGKIKKLKSRETECICVRNPPRIRRKIERNEKKKFLEKEKENVSEKENECD